MSRFSSLSLSLCLCLLPWNGKHYPTIIIIAIRYCSHKLCRVIFVRTYKLKHKEWEKRRAKEKDREKRKKRKKETDKHSHVMYKFHINFIHFFVHSLALLYGYRRINVYCCVSCCEKLIDISVYMFHSCMAYTQTHTCKHTHRHSEQHRREKDEEENKKKGYK